MKPVSIKAALVILKRQIIYFVGKMITRYRKYNRVVIDKSIMPSLIGTDRFINSIQLARFINAIRAAQRTYLRITNNNELANNKDRFEQILTMSALLYEATRGFSKLSPWLRHLKSWDIHTEEIKFLNREFGKSSSILNTVVASIRNKVVYHFDRDVISESLRRLPIKEQTVFAASKSMINKDMIFTVVDDLIIDYVISLIPGTLPEKEKYGLFLNYVTHFSEMLIRVSTDLIIEYIKEYAMVDKAKLS